MNLNEKHPMVFALAGENETRAKPNLSIHASCICIDAEQRELLSQIRDIVTDTKGAL